MLLLIINILMKKYYFYLFIISFLFITCKKQVFLYQPIIDETCKKVIIDNIDDSLYLKCINEIKLIPLEQFDKSYYFLNPELLMINDSSIVLIDRDNGMIAGFINNKKTFGRRFIGRGPNEFIDYGNSFLFNDMFGVYDKSLQKCLYYNIEGQLIKTIKITEGYYIEFYPITSSLGLGLDNSEDDYYSFIFDQSRGEIKNKDIFLGPIHSKLLTRRQHVSKNGRDVSFYIPFSYVIYGIDSLSCKINQKFYLDFPNKLDLSDVREHLYSPYLYSYVLSSGCSGDLSHFLETDRYYSFDTMVKQSSYKVLLDKNTAKCYLYDISHGIKKTDPFINQLLSVLNPIGSYHNQLFMCCDYQSYKELEKNCKKEERKHMEQIMSDIRNYQEYYKITDDSKLYFSIELTD